MTLDNKIIVKIEINRIACFTIWLLRKQSFFSLDIFKIRKLPNFLVLYKLFVMVKKQKTIQKANNMLNSVLSLKNNLPL